ncbi:hypothetical protein POM88_026116 [Heracleum sosnowskyi]|uniref:Uncharacterized protein n=1 Tax=Heracleum sosnowskyi TaxID=360622 RepID=A0AAD8I575_9APIA|nr:hypothetical protein POM88_026116 [Heracleum sosnowskyi]
MNSISLKEEEYRKARAEVKRKNAYLGGYSVEGLSVGGHETCVIVPELKSAFDIGRYITVSLADIRKEVQCPICLGIDVRLKLHLYKVSFLLLTRKLKAAKREVKMAMNTARGKDYYMAVYLKSQLEYARGNHRESDESIIALENIKHQLYTFLSISIVVNQYLLHVVSTKPAYLRIVNSSVFCSGLLLRAQVAKCVEIGLPELIILVVFSQLLGNLIAHTKRKRRSRSGTNLLVTLDKLRPVITDIRKHADNIKGSQIVTGMDGGNLKADKGRKHLEEEYLELEEKIIILFDVVENMSLMLKKLRKANPDLNFDIGPLSATPTSGQDDNNTPTTQGGTEF